MANLNFYATREDQIALLEFLFARIHCRVFESYSRLDEELREFSSIEDLDGVFELGSAPDGVPGRHALLQLWAPEVSSEVRIRRIELDKRRRRRHTHRYCIEGWGLMQLYLGSVGEQKISCSHYGHNSEIRARNWEPTDGSALGPVAAWDWRRLEQISRKIQYHIRHRLSRIKQGSRPVLYGAEKALVAGFTTVG